MYAIRRTRGSTTGMAAAGRDRVVEHRSSELDSYIVIGMSSARNGFQLGCVLGLAGGIVVGSGRVMEV